MPIRVYLSTADRPRPVVVVSHGLGGSRDSIHHLAIVAITTKFWQAYLEDDTAAKGWLQSQQPRSDARLVSEDVWQWK